MAEKFEHGETVYLPVTITNTDPGYGYDYKVSFNDFVDNAQCSITVGESQIKTAEEIAGPIKTKADAMTVTVDSLQKENDELKAKVAELTTWYNEANRTASEAAEANDELKAKIAELRAERDKFAKTAKDKADLANKACDERNDVQGDLETAKAIVDHLQEENKDLKRTLEVVEAARDGAIDESLERKNRVTTMEEVIVALVEKIRRLEGEN